ncbi:MAG: acetate--CoA ligase family protein [archaeon]
MTGFIADKKLIESYGLPFAKTFLVENYRELSKAALNLGYPLVLKLFSLQASHKTNFGGVITGLHSFKEARQAFKKIKVNALQNKVSFNGALVQKQLNGLELIIGGKKDAQFGQTILFGLGGTSVEILKDFSLRVCPITKKDAGAMIKEIKTFKLLNGYRGKEKVNLKLLEELLLKVNDLLLKENLKELDLNPLIAFDNKITAVDVRIVR